MAKNEKKNIFEKMKNKNLEKLEIFDLEGNLIEIKRRDKYYEEVKKEFATTGKISKKVKNMRVILMNSDGRIYIQKRSYFKNENPGLLDKTVGGHVVAGHSLLLTVVQECHEELGFPAVILNDDEFNKALFSTNLQIVGILRQVELAENFISIRKTADGKIFEQPLINAFYIGYFDGPIKFCDGESVGIETFTIEQLKKIISEKPEIFTEDLKFMIKRYEKFLGPIEKNKKIIYGFEKK